MIQEPIIEVSCTNEGDVTYKVRTTLLTTSAYGIILANLAQQMSQMLSEEYGCDRDQTLARILKSMGAELQQAYPLQQMQ